MTRANDRKLREKSTDDLTMPTRVKGKGRKDDNKRISG